MKLNDKIIAEDMQQIFDKTKNRIGCLENKTVFVTGASGMLTTYLIYFFAYLNLTKGFHITINALVRNKQKAQSRFQGIDTLPFFHYIHQDVCDTIQLEGEIDYVIHGAGNASPRYILSDPVGIIKANTLGTMSILEACKEREIKNFLFLSTREVYGKVENQSSVAEDDMGICLINELRACYPESKRMAETILEAYHQQYHIPYSIARIAHAYGPGMTLENDGRIMSDLISNVVKRENIVLKSDGTADRAFCYLSDAVSALILILLSEPNREIYNVANENESHMIRDVAQMLIDLFPERNIQVVYQIPEQIGQGYSKIGRTKLNLKKLNQLGWSPDVCLKDGLKRTVNSFDGEYL